MALSRRTGRSRSTLILLILVSVTVITLDFRGDGAEVFDAVREGASDVLAPVRDAADDALSPVGDAFSGVTDYGRLEDQNAELRARIADLEGERLRSEEAERELATLADQLDLDWVGDIDQVAARVVTVPVSNFEQTIELDKGTDDGLAEGNPVVTGSGLVGQVVSASGSRSTVRLVTDPASVVAVLLAGDRDQGSATGEGPGEDLTVDFIEPEVVLDAGEVVVTSGLTRGAYPKGIPVGRVVEARAGGGELQQRVTIEPVADLDHLEFVQVLRWTPAP